MLEQTFAMGVACAICTVTLYKLLSTSAIWPFGSRRDESRRS